MSSTSGTHTFETEIGDCGLAWTARGIDLAQLPEATHEETLARLQSRAGDRPHRARAPREIAAVARRVRRHLSGKLDPLDDIELDLRGTRPFARKLYGKLRRVAPGETITYGDLADRVGRPGAARAAGGAVGANPMPLLVPCHRVVGARGALGGFSAYSGTVMKERLLFTEGVILDRARADGIAHLSRVDPVLRRIIRQVGPYQPSLHRGGDAYETLVESVLHQQISMAAAATISKRLREQGDGESFPGPRELARMREARLRRAGISRQKASYLRDLAGRIACGDLDLDRLPRLSDEQVIDTLTEVRGFGRWSAQMVLIFHLGRLDVLPVADLGFKKGVRAAYGGADNPSEAELERRGESWRPYRSMATWYLWQSLKRGGIK